jgi:hypothetical protein
MADKRKINLKERLGKGSSRNSSSGTPIPGAPKSVRPGVIPPPAISSAPPLGAIPAPPFGVPGQQPAPVGPKVSGGGGPFASVENAPSKQVQQEIRVEVGEEAKEAAKSMRKFILIAGIVGVGLGGAIAYPMGQGKEHKRNEANAVINAYDLATEMYTSNKSLQKFSDRLDEAINQMKSRKYDEKFASDLGGVSIPFDSTKLVGKSVNYYQAKTLNSLFKYTTTVEEIASRKSSLANVYSAQKKGIEESFTPNEKLDFQFSVLILGDKKGPIAFLTPLKEPMPTGKDRPKKFKITDITGGKPKDMEVVPYEKGDPMAEKDGKRMAIPLSVDGQRAAFPNDLAQHILLEMLKTQALLKGTEKEPGAIKLGQDVVNDLRDKVLRIDPKIALKFTNFLKEQEAKK